LLRAAVPYLAYAFISLVGATSRLRWHKTEYFDQARADGPVIYAFWHQRQVIFTYTHRDAGASILVSRSRDGAMIADTMRLSRIDAVRGSSSRGGRAAARELLAVLETGKDAGLTPDGPKGPARRVKPGVLYLAQRSGRPIIPIASSVSRRIEMHKAWDNFHVPLPFSRIDVVYGEPLTVAEDADLDTVAAELERRLNAATAEADALAA
jgi:lysophospholipid acyltransferase (LPLAT)-like uncharacterized protein